jgi:uncharacterized protein (DUF362 family)
MMKTTRREFIKKATFWGGTLGVSQIINYPIINSFAQLPKTTLAVVKGDRTQATKRAINLLGGMGSFVKKGNRVVLKPNMSFPHPPDRATNTHPEVVATVARLCIQSGAKEVLILDFPFNRPESCLRLSGIPDASKGIPHVHTFALVEEKFFQEIPVPKGKVIDSIKIMKDVLFCDVFINIPTAKSHTTTGVSLGLKGLMGIMWDREYFHSQVDINQAIADLASAVKIDLTILDMSRSLANGGPSGPGKIETSSTIIAGTDPVAVDSLGVSQVKWYGQTFAGSQVKHIVTAHKMGLGTMNISEAAIMRETV